MKISVTERIILEYLVMAYENTTGSYNILRNPKFGAMSYDLFTPNTTFVTPDGNITIDDEEKKEAWKLAKGISKLILKDKWTKKEAENYYKSALFCRIMSTVAFHGWDFKIIIESDPRQINVEFYEKKYKQQIEELLCTTK